MTRSQQVLQQRSVNWTHAETETKYETDISDKPTEIQTETETNSDKDKPGSKDTWNELSRIKKEMYYIIQHYQAGHNRKIESETESETVNIWLPHLCLKCYPTSPHDSTNENVRNSSNGGGGKVEGQKNLLKKGERRKEVPDMEDNNMTLRVTFHDYLIEKQTFSLTMQYSHFVQVVVTFTCV